MEALKHNFAFEMSIFGIDVEGLYLFLEDSEEDKEKWSITHAELSEAWLDGWRSTTLYPSLMILAAWM